MIECIPNVSGGRDAPLIGAIAEAIRGTAGVHLLNVHSDPDHNRSVFTFASEEAAALREAVLRMYEIAVERIDLRRHRGAHPRIGAIDVVPFVPLEGSTMEECIAAVDRFEPAGQTPWENGCCEPTNFKGGTTGLGRGVRLCFVVAALQPARPILGERDLGGKTQGWG